MPNSPPNLLQPSSPKIFASAGSILGSTLRCIKDLLGHTATLQEDWAREAPLNPLCIRLRNKRRRAVNPRRSPALERSIYR